MNTIDIPLTAICGDNNAWGIAAYDARPAAEQARAAIREFRTAGGQCVNGYAADGYAFRRDLENNIKAEFTTPTHVLRVLAAGNFNAGGTSEYPATLFAV